MEEDGGACGSGELLNFLCCYIYSTASFMLDLCIYLEKCRKCVFKRTLKANKKNKRFWVWSLTAARIIWQETAMWETSGFAQRSGNSAHNCCRWERAVSTPVTKGGFSRPANPEVARPADWYLRVSVSHGPKCVCLCVHVCVYVCVCVGGGGVQRLRSEQE